MSKRPYPRVRYTGELAKPIRMQDYENDNALIDAIDNRLKTLASLYGVDPEDHPNAGWELATLLAHAHVPGLRIPRSRGVRRKATWLAGWGEWLRWEVDDIRERDHCTITKAIAQLRADKSKPWRKHPQGTLEARYRDASRRYRAASPRDRIAWALLGAACRAAATD
jgi:hypothetical protein